MTEDQIRDELRALVYISPFTGNYTLYQFIQPRFDQLVRAILDESREAMPS